MQALQQQRKTNKQITLFDIGQFVLINRKGKAFYDWSDIDIYKAFLSGAKNNTAAIDLDDNNNLIGVVIVERNDEYKLIHVNNIICIAKDGLKRFIKLFKAVYPGYDLQATRRDKLTRYKNTARFCKLIEILT